MSKNKIEELTAEQAEFYYMLQHRIQCKRIKKLESALKSIANSTCCGDCQEASLVAKEALKEDVGCGW